MAHDPSTSTEARPWHPIGIGDYQVPQRDSKEGLARAWRKLWKSTEAATGEELLDPELLPADVVAHLVPSVDLEAAAASLEPELQDWFERAPGAPRSVALVGPPGSAVQEVLEAWADRTASLCLSAPSPAELDRGLWNLALPEERGLALVLPPLERLFLRRWGGLDLLRTLLERLQREGRRFVAACDSWSWAYLRRTLTGSHAGFDRVLAPAPFTGTVLRTWLQGLDPGVVFVDERTGEPMLAAGAEVHPFLRALAARSRGVPGLAAAIWRLALCSAKLGAPVGGVRRCKLPRWADVAEPCLPPGAGKPAALVLHALFVHGGLAENLLPTVLPLAASEVQGVLWALHGHGIVSEEDRVWRVSAIGLPAARTHLANLNLPLDDF